MSPIQQMLLGVGAVATKTYVDDIFSSYLWTGNSSSRSINNGVDLSTEGGMAWIKRRNSGGNHQILDTARGATKALYSNDSSAEETFTNGLTAFNSNGFSLGNHGNYNTSSNPYVSWTFRKAPGFFDVVTYTGNGSSNHQISHNLGSIPGCIMVKCTSESQDWMVYHVGTTDSAGPGGAYLKLNTNAAQWGSSGGFYNTTATSTVFTLGDADIGNKSNASYVAYLFAGGESTAATARSVDFDGSGDSLSATPASGENYQLSGDFTIECWVKPTNDTGEGVFAQSSIASWSSWGAALMMTSGTFRLHTKAGGTEADRITGPTVKKGQWQHIALVRSGSTVTMYVNGLNEGSYSDSDLWGGSGSSAWFTIGAENRDGAANELTGSISNFRVTRGQALYTSSFRPSTEPLTTTSQGATSSNVIVLACNNASVTGATVKDNISSNGDPTASSDSPFDDPAAFTFGDAGDQNVIKCGSYVGTGSAGIEVNIGFEPQLILVKSTASGENWEIYDSMRGIVDGLNQSDRRLRPNTSDAEDDNPGFFSLRPNGFIVNGTSGSVNQNGVTFVFLAIRRPDGYVGKPPELGTGVFAMDTGAGAGAAFGFDSGFPVDLALRKQPASTDDWYIYPRLTTGKALKTNSTASESAEAEIFDSNVGWAYDYGSNYQAWMWKRHAGFDVICYKGDGVNGRSIAHSMNDVPEMMIVKRRSSTEDWTVYHTGLTSVNYHLTLNSEGNEVDMTSTPEKVWKSVPTATHFEIGSHDRVNTDGEDYLALLFSSIDNISKIGSYSGNDSGQTITTGFQPRFIIIKQLAHNSWYTFDTVRGWSQNNQDWYLRLEGNYAQSDSVNDRPDDIGHPLSTGFYLKGDTNNDLVATNKTGSSYIYYCHA